MSCFKRFLPFSASDYAMRDAPAVQSGTIPETLLAERGKLKVIELEGARNVRDLGGTPVSGGREVVPGLFFRGSALAGITPHDRTLLFEELGIACIVDVRTGWEREAKPDPDVSGVENLHIPFYDLEKVGLEYTTPAPGT